jgi:hypothetical protein
MEFRVSIASERQRVEAAALVDECYWSAYGIRPSELFRGELPPFRHEVLVATRPDGGVLGTATLSWPSAEGLFPGEYLFHGDFHKPGLSFDWPHMVEYGKLAIHPEAPREVFKELQRGFVRFGRTCGITGFVAVVRTELGERLRQCFAYQTIATELYDTGPIEERLLRKLSTYIDKGNLQFIASSLDAVAEGLSVND